jgi:hypothetical protein
LLQGTEVFDLANVVSDPGIRKQIDQFGTPEIRDKMRWVFISTRNVGVIYLDNFVFLALIQLNGMVHLISFQVILMSFYVFSNSVV